MQMGQRSLKFITVGTLTLEKSEFVYCGMG